jgi:hypothetical protein
MKNLEQLITAWSEGHWEFSLAFEGLSDEDLWKRADPRLLSVGELAGHVAYCDVVMWGMKGPEESPVKSVIVDKRFAYYTSNIGEPAKLDIGVVEMLNELKRVLEETKASVLALDPDSEDPLPCNEKVTWGQYLRYRVFHIAYHTGQAYSVRHLLGHTTTDN